MNQKELDEIKERCDKATEGPWITGGCSGRMITTPDGYVGDGFIADVDTKVHADFIAHARQDVPALLAEIESLNSRLSEFGTIRAQLQTASYSTNKGAEDLAKFILQIWPEPPKEG